MVIDHILPLRQVLFIEDSEDDAILQAVSHIPIRRAADRSASAGW
ncbi:hypothetical protein ABID99_003457 [Mucilaginibacter sp. OAE612]